MNAAENMAAFAACSMKRLGAMKYKALDINTRRVRGSVDRPFHDRGVDSLGYVLGCVVCLIK